MKKEREKIVLNKKEIIYLFQYIILFLIVSFILSRIYIKTKIIKMSDRRYLIRKKLYISFLFLFLEFSFTNEN